MAGISGAEYQGRGTCAEKIAPKINLRVPLNLLLNISTKVHMHKVKILDVGQKRNWSYNQ